MTEGFDLIFEWLAMVDHPTLHPPLNFRDLSRLVLPRSFRTLTPAESEELHEVLR